MEVKKFEDFLNEGVNGTIDIYYEKISSRYGQLYDVFSAQCKTELKKYLASNKDMIKVDIKKCIEYWKTVEPEEGELEIDVIDDMENQCEEYQYIKELYDGSDLNDVYEKFISGIIAKYKIDAIKKIDDYQDYLNAHWGELSQEVKNGFPDINRGKKSNIWDFNENK